jgi:5-hydroxyisourate hydrolase
VEDSVTQGPNHPAPTISTHVLDTERGAPAVGVHVTLYRLADDGRPLRITQALTDADGRVRDLLERPLAAGDYRLEFDLAREIAPEPPAHDSPAPNVARMRDRPAAPPVPAPPAEAERFFRRLTIDLRVTDTGRSYHVPLLLAPFSVTTYRGS